jgi:hypothetical protein
MNQHLRHVVARVCWCLVIAVSAIVGPAELTVAGDVEPGPGPTTVVVTFDCTADQTPNLIVPLLQYDEVFPAGTETTEFDFGEIEFADTSLMIDCTPYDDADVECFAVLNVAEEGLVILRETLGEYCLLPDPRPIGGPTTSTSTSTSTSSPTTAVPSSDATPADGLPPTGSGGRGALVATAALVLGALLVALSRRHTPTVRSDA